MILASCVFAALGTLFASGSAQMPCQVLIPTMLIRWPLLFISGVFVPLDQMVPWMRTLSYFSPLAYAMDLLNHAIVGSSIGGKVVEWARGLGMCRFTQPGAPLGGIQSPLVDLGMLVALIAVFFVPSLMLHHRSRRLGY